MEKTKFKNTKLTHDNDCENKSELSYSLYNTPSSSPSLEPISSIKIPIIDKQINKYSRNITTTDNKTIEIKTNENSKIISDDLTFDSIILNLKIISKLKPGFKLSVKENEDSKDILPTIFIDTSYLQYFYRMLGDNSRELTTTFLENLDSEINKKIEELVTRGETYMFLNSKENILLNLSHNLNLSLVGLNNLINTYNNDEYTISKIEMIINNFELKIRKISSIIKIN
jgi:hypothetical protein